MLRTDSHQKLPNTYFSASELCSDNCSKKHSFGLKIFQNVQKKWQSCRTNTQNGRRGIALRSNSARQASFRVTIFCWPPELSKHIWKLRILDKTSNEFWKRTFSVFVLQKWDFICGAEINLQMPTNLSKRAALPKTLQARKCCDLWANCIQLFPANSYFSSDLNKV